MEKASYDVLEPQHYREVSEFHNSSALFNQTFKVPNRGVVAVARQTDGSRCFIFNALHRKKNLEQG